jgi:hypothetical protein
LQPAAEPARRKNGKMGTWEPPSEPESTAPPQQDDRPEDDQQSGFGTWSGN